MDPHKKSDYFDNSKDKIPKGDKVQKMESDEEDIPDLGFGSDRKLKDNKEKKGSDNEHAIEADLAGLEDVEGEMS